MWWEYVIVFVMAALSASILPGTTEVTMAGVFAMGQATFVPVVIVATLGSVAGSAAQWSLGRFLAQYKDHKRFPLKADQYDKYAAWIQKYGVWALGMSWLPGVGDVLTLVGGLFRTPFFLSMALVGVAKGARFALFAYLFVTAEPYARDLFGLDAPSAEPAAITEPATQN
jgi:membrane protein YqaA with SNARE-associated domain